MSGRLHERFVLVAITAQDHRQPGHAFAADQANLDGTRIAVGHDGGKTGRGKIDSFNRLAAPLQNLAHGKVSGLQVWLQKLEIGFRNRQRMRF